MTVYVDDMRARYHGMIMCHMMADDVFELHQMAEALGMRRDWFQDTPGWPHYDIPLARRAQAVRMGAVECTQRELVRRFSGRFRIPVRGGR